jgi:outer membrane protein OmpA-like peptidoglycan-associated protein
MIIARKTFLFIVFILTSIILEAQEFELINVDTITDCSRAMNIVPLDSFGFTTPPPGNGKVIEYIKNPEKSLYYFEDEHHTSWYKIEMPYSGILTFDIVPLRIEDDYDFILYKYTDNNFCRDVKAHSIIPVRTAISRNDKSIGSKTGLSITATSNYIHSGPGDSYSNAIKVKKGEIYFLVLDNCYKNGMGHKIIFKPLIEYIIKGTTIDQQSGKPIKANVNLIDLSDYDTISFTVSDSISGTYNLKTYTKDSLKGNFELLVSAPGYFYFDTTIKVKTLVDTTNYLNLPVPRLEKGKRIRLNDINFYGNTTVPYPETKYIFIKLLEVMVKNPKLVIQIEGHTNGCRGGIEYSQNLSDARAKAVRNYLIHYKINPRRVYAVGFGCRYMIYPDPKNELEGKLNRRVEIKVISF